MTELELFDKLNPKRDLPQATCDVISQVYWVMAKENDQLVSLSVELEKENEQLKKNAIVWHNLTDDETDIPVEDGKEYLVLLKNKRIVINELDYDDGYFFEDFDWEDIEAWAELPEIKK